MLSADAPAPKLGAWPRRGSTDRRRRRVRRSGARPRRGVRRVSRPRGRRSTSTISTSRRTCSRAPRPRSGSCVDGERTEAEIVTDLAEAFEVPAEVVGRRRASVRRPPTGPGPDRSRPPPESAGLVSSRDFALELGDRRARRTSAVPRARRISPQTNGSTTTIASPISAISTGVRLVLAGAERGPAGLVEQGQAGHREHDHDAAADERLRDPRSDLAAEDRARARSRSPAAPGCASRGR